MMLTKWNSSEVGLFLVDRDYEWTKKHRVHLTKNNPATATAESPISSDHATYLISVVLC